jgi:hypothetical protein
LLNWPAADLSFPAIQTSRISTVDFRLNHSLRSGRSVFSALDRITADALSWSKSTAGFGTRASRRLPCKSVSREKHTISGRARESAQCDVIRTYSYAVVASRLMVPAIAEPDIHLLSKAPGSPHRRLSLCSLPVLKQFVESLRSLFSFAQSPTGGTWQPAHR